MSRFHSQLCVKQVDEVAGIWELEQDFWYWSDKIGMIKVPAGFKTDFASVPRIPMLYSMLGDKGQKASVVHDWLYSTQCVSRAEADAVFREALAVSGYDWFTRTAMWLGVRVGGAVPWNMKNVEQKPNVQYFMDLVGGP